MLQVAMQMGLDHALHAQYLVRVPLKPNEF